MKYQVYADNAATTRLDEVAFEAMLPWLKDNYGNASQPYSFAREPKKALAAARETIAACIGANPEEIFFTSGGTESDNWVIKSSAFADVDRRATITSAFEHHAILRSCATIERLGYPVAYLRPTADGLILVDTLRRIITKRTRLVSVMFANNELGAVQPVKDLCAVAHEYGALFHTDAVQAVGHIPIDVHDLGIDYLSASAHKFNGPKGIGFLYIRKGADLLPYADGGSQEKGKRAGTENLASIVGMAAALRENCCAMDKNIQHVRSLEKRLLAGMREASVKFIRNGGSNTLPGLLSLSVPGKDGEAIMHRMDLMGISISTGAACDSVNTQKSHVLDAINLEDELAFGTIRISLGRYNTESDVDLIVSCLSRILNT